MLHCRWKNVWVWLPGIWLEVLLCWNCLWWWVVELLFLAWCKCRLYVMHWLPWLESTWCLLWLGLLWLCWLCLVGLAGHLPVETGMLIFLAHPPSFHLLCFLVRSKYGPFYHASGPRILICFKHGHLLPGLICHYGAVGRHWLGSYGPIGRSCPLVRMVWVGKKCSVRHG